MILDSLEAEIVSDAVNQYLRVHPHLNPEYWEARNTAQKKLRKQAETISPDAYTDAERDAIYVSICLAVGNQAQQIAWGVPNTIDLRWRMQQLTALRSKMEHLGEEDGVS
jgi:hypothetical protein